MAAAEAAEAGRRRRRGRPLRQHAARELAGRPARVGGVTEAARAYARTWSGGGGVLVRGRPMVYGFNTFLMTLTLCFSIKALTF